MAPYGSYGKWGERYVPQSKYNSAYYKILRLNICWSNVNSYWRKAEFDKMNWELDIIWAELHTDSTKEWKNRIREIDKKIALAKFRKNKSDYIKYIRKKWLFLFDVEKEQGLGKSYYDDTEEELD